MKRTVYIIPGYDEFFNVQKGYRKIAQYFINQDFQVIHIKIDWKQTTDGFESYIKQFKKQFNKHTKDDEVIILGYSFGSMVAFLTAKFTNPNLLILCSPSPYYLEDLNKIERRWLKWWDKNFKSNYSFKETVKNIKTKTFILYGTLEHRSVIQRSWQMRSHLKNSQLFKVMNAKHNLHSKIYIKKLESIIKKLK